MKAKRNLLFLILAMILLFVGMKMVYDKNLKEGVGKEIKEVTSEEESKENIILETSEEVEDGRKEKAFLLEFQDMQGNPVSLSDFQEQPIVLNFWASWCPPCQMEMPYFVSLYEEYRKDVIFIMLNQTDGSRETKESALAFMDQENLRLPIYFDYGGEVAIAFEAFHLPTTFFIDQEGKLVSSHKGYISEEILRSNIEKIVKEEE